ncbi:Potassium channel subfamily T member 2 [Porphyridium purpureum]|uniref:Potassium channel subfamily T member 2 n=1 Tax=Porphyridium purpureum TaxID=35688 RepID=A0A5J4YSF2_PORPP|nr:Potassium channel subfamily T member 2 [Porphyridium purpureum]|eukprot:POR4124..scf236_6
MATKKAWEPSWLAEFALLRIALALWGVYLLLALLITGSKLLARYLQMKFDERQMRDYQIASALSGDALYSDNEFEITLMQRRPPLLRLMSSFVLATRRLRAAVRRRLNSAGAMSTQSWRVGYILACFAVCTHYVYETYMQSPVLSPVAWFLLGVWALLLALSACVAYLYTENPMRRVLSLPFIVQCVCVVSVLFSMRGIWLNFNFLHAFLALHVHNTNYASFESAQVRSSSMSNRWTMVRLATSILMQFLTFIFIAASAIQLFENLGDPTVELMLEEYDMDWFNALYFSVVAVATVGFGDFVPYTMLGRLWISFNVLFAAYLISVEITQLVETLAQSRFGAGSYRNAAFDARHVVLTGLFTFNSLQEFVREFFIDVRFDGYQLVVLSSVPLWQEDELRAFLASNNMYMHETFFLNGSCLKEDDLQRARVETASAVYFLSIPQAPDPHAVDSNALKALLSIRRYCAHVPIFSLHSVSSSAFQFRVATQQSPHVHVMSEAKKKKKRRKTTNGKRQENNESVAHKGFSLSKLFADARSAATATTLDGATMSATAQALKYDQELAERNPLLRSTSIGVEDFFLTLLAENIFANGMSTLLANLILPVKPQGRQGDRPFLSEYKLGAESLFDYIRVPEQLNKVPLARVLLEFLDFGIIPIAARAVGEFKWQMLSTSSVLQGAHLVLVITYHTGRPVLDRVMDLLLEHVLECLDAERMAAEEVSSDDESAQVDKADDLHNQDDGNVYSCGNEDWPSVVPLASSSRMRPAAESAAARQHMMPLSRLGTGGVFGSGSGHRDDSSVSTLLRNTQKNGTTHASSPPRPGVRVVEEHEKFDTRLKGHVICCLSRSVSVDSLGIFLAKVLGPRTGVRAPGVPLVLTRYESSQHLLAELEGFSGANSFVLLGNPFSPPTLRKAQLESARAVVFLSSMGQPDISSRTGAQGARSDMSYMSGITSQISNVQSANQYNTDSGAIFLWLTLDHMLTKTLDVFPCCYLSSNESLQLLPTPGFPRRTGIQLGEQHDAQIALKRELLPKSKAKRDKNNKTQTNGRNSQGRLRETGRSGSASGRLVTPGFGLSSLPYGSRSRSNMNINYSVGRAGSLSRTLLSDLDLMDDLMDDDSASVHARQQNSDEIFSAREEFFERERFASGEVVVPSVLVSLLLRELHEPGFSSAIVELIGASETQKSWIRLVDVPRLWVQGAENSSGQGSSSPSCRTYREVCEVLVRFGCIPLGLYRSGEAPVRLEVESTVWQRGLGGTTHTYTWSDVVSQSGGASANMNGGAMGTASIPPSRNALFRASGFNDAAADDPSITGLRHVRSVAMRTDLLWSLQDEVQNLLQQEGRGSSIAQDGGDEHEEDGEHTPLPSPPAPKVYYCKSTRRRISYCELLDGQNLLPYVFCQPEAYCAVAAADAVFVFCPPGLKIPCGMCWVESESDSARPCDCTKG